MLIDAICVSVDYSSLLAPSLATWQAGCRYFTIVTSLEDRATQELASHNGTQLLTTDAFYRDGAFFNKGRAIQEAREAFPHPDWTLLVDADVVPPANWLEVLQYAEPRPGFLYGARRQTEGGTMIADGELAGFFQLFHASDPNAGPLPTRYIHAGNYDSEFMMRWPGNRQVILPLVLTHQGEPGRNWCGVGRDAELAAIRKQRRHRSWRREIVGR